jgi:hypothetical protein
LTRLAGLEEGPPGATWYAEEEDEAEAFVVICCAKEEEAEVELGPRGDEPWLMWMISLYLAMIRRIGR